ncbi:uncharacterized protein LOC133731966 [Rosa rugosa]|uniref:uncharacterized protein LOC133731966 n=1 Tax=Rosa rugosa TaxID=74645 RepID=UPI002B405B27|nr:uncharacterized protein LOC133731966 [Rosa rugosa]
MPGSIATKDALFHRHISRSPLCPLCNLENETIEHVLFTCPWTRCVWFAHPLGYRFPLESITSLARWLQWLKSYFVDGSGDKSLLHTHVAFILWHIWKERCVCVFNHTPPTPDLVACKSFDAALEYIQRPLPRCVRLVTQPLTSPSFWTPPPLGTFKVNTDAAWHSDSLSCGIAVLIRNSSGELVAGSNQSLHAFSAVAAEALAVLAGLTLVVSLNLSPIILASDSLHVISALTTENFTMDWTVAPLIWKIRSLATSHSHVSWSWSSRQANLAADYIAALASRRMCPSDWVSNPPSSFLNLLLSDASQASHISSQNSVPFGFDVG